MTSRRIPTDNLPNLRDLGGMTAADGRHIREGMLFRCGELVAASESDVKLLERIGLIRVFDLRSIQERTEKPDICPKGAENPHLPILPDLQTGITREKDSEDTINNMILQTLRKDPNSAIRFMADTYRIFIRSDFAVAQYRHFLDEVLSADGPVLWHCAAGKDRAGFAAILIETILGVSGEDVREDYLYTNECLAGMNGEIIARFPAEHLTDEIRSALLDFFGAREAYIDSAYDEAEKLFGGLEGYIEKALGVDDAMRQAFRDKYLV